MILDAIFHICFYIFMPATFIIGFLIHDFNEIDIFKFKSIKSFQEQYKFKYKFHLYFFFFINSFFLFFFYQVDLVIGYLKKTIIKN